jgi:hypothetical protein
LLLLGHRPEIRARAGLLDVRLLPLHRLGGILGCRPPPTRTRGYASTGSFFLSFFLMYLHSG